MLLATQSPPPRCRASAEEALGTVVAVGIASPVAEAEKAAPSAAVAELQQRCLRLESEKRELQAEQDTSLSLLGVALGSPLRSPQADLRSPNHTSNLGDALTKERILAHIQARLQATAAGDSPIRDVGEAQAMLAVLEKAAGCAEELVAASPVKDCADEGRSPEPATETVDAEVGEDRVWRPARAVRGKRRSSGGGGVFSCCAAPAEG